MATNPKFVDPTSVHKAVYFTKRCTKDATVFQGTVQKLARHMSTPAVWKKEATVSKAMTGLQDPMFNPPSRLVRQYYNHEGGSVTTDRAVAGTKNILVMDDLDYTIETGEYSRKISQYKTHLKVWQNSNAKGSRLSSSTVPNICRLS